MGIKNERCPLTVLKDFFIHEIYWLYGKITSWFVLTFLSPLYNFSFTRYFSIYVKYDYFLTLETNIIRTVIFYNEIIEVMFISPSND